MKRLLVVLLLAGCGAESQGDDATGEPGMAAGAENLLADTGAEDPAKLRARVLAAMAPILPDAASARYGGIRSGVAGSVCGQVEAKSADGKYAGPRPFVISPQGVAVISPTAQISFENPEETFPDFYIRWCASPEELATIGPRVAIDEAGMPPPPTADVIPEVPADLDVPVPPPPPAQIPVPPDTRWGGDGKAAGKAPPRTSGDDSFYNVVVRDEGSAK